MVSRSEIPEAVTDYVTASNAKNISKVLSLFANDAVVKDEGVSYHGIKEIGEWQRKINEAYDFKMEIKKVEANDSTCTIITTLTGTFPGKNPVDVEQVFVFDNDKIVILNIH